MNSIELKRRSLELSNKTDIETIPPTEVGGILYDTVEYMENVEINGSSLGIRKTYATVSAMEADQEPRDDKDGSPLRRGMLVNIYNQEDLESADNGKVFSWQNPGWAFRTKLDAGYATKAELAEQEAETDAKFSELEAFEAFIGTQSGLFIIDLGGCSEGYYTGNVGGIVQETNTSGYKYNPVLISNTNGRKLVVVLTGTFSESSTRIIGITNQSDVLHSIKLEREPTTKVGNSYIYVFNIDEECKQLFISHSTTAKLQGAYITDGGVSVNEFENLMSYTKDIKKNIDTKLFEPKESIRASEIGIDYENSIDTLIPSNTEIKVITKGCDAFNGWFLYINDEVQSYSGDVEINILKDFDINSIKIKRNGVNVVKNQDVTLTINNDNSLYTRIIRVENTIVHIEDETNSIKKDTSLLNDKIDSILENFDVKEKLYPLLDLGYYYSNNSTTPIKHSGYYTQEENAIDISAYEGEDLKVIFDNINSTSSRCCLIADADDTILAYITESSLSMNNNNCYEKTVKIPVGSKRLYISFSNNVTEYSFLIGKTIKNSLNRVVVYVDAEQGSDTNDGTLTSPYATFKKALLATGENTQIIFSGKTKEAINLKTKENQASIIIVGVQGRSNQIDMGTYLNMQLYEGGLYVADATLPNEDITIYQKGVNDINTLIVDEERLPMQRGKEYRCEHLQLKKMASLEELSLPQTADAYYYDSTLKKIYAKTTNTDYNTYPIVVSSNNGFGLFGNDGTVHLEMYNIEFVFCSAKCDLCNGAVIQDCKVGYSFNSAGFRYNMAVGIKFIRCEVCRVDNSRIGDGFNAHALLDEEEFSKAPVFAKHVSATLIDCWSHDNRDDGYSDHERSETVLRGGLYEHNGKGGVTPSYGSHCTCYNVIARNNYNGFYYTGSVADITPSEGGKYGQLVCVECISQNNKTEDGSQGFGFRIDGKKNNMYLYNCLSIDNNVGYGADDDNTVILYSCKSLRDNQIKSQTGTFIHENGLFVE